MSIRRAIVVALALGAASAGLPADAGATPDAGATQLSNERTVTRWAYANELAAARVFPSRRAHKITRGRLPGTNVGDPSRLAAQIVQGDVTRQEDICKLVDTAWEKYGSADILVNNAGMEKKSMFWDTPEAEYDQIMAVMKRSEQLIQNRLGVRQKRA